MKTNLKIIVCLLVTVTTYAQVSVTSIVGVGKIGSGRYGTKISSGTYIVDMWQTFEFNDPLVSNLEANDNTAVGTWLTNDASVLFSISTSGERALLGTINGNTDSGHTRGLRKVFSSTTIANVQYDLGPANTKNSASVGSWIMFSANGTAGADKRILDFDSASLNVATVILQFPTRTISFLNGGNSNGVALVAGNFYWVTTQINRNATSYVRVYDSTGVQIGTDATITATDNPIRYLSLGNSTPDAADGSFDFFWDDVTFDYTDSTYPLGP